MKNTLYVLVVSGLFGCVNAKNEMVVNANLSDNHSKAAVSEQVPSQTSPHNLIHILKDVNSPADKNKLYDYQFNGHQFTATTKRLIRGTVVYNTQLSVFGKLKGSVVLISTSDLSAFSSGFHVESIARNTYRLTPLNHSALLLDVLKYLQKFGQVELEVDYSPLNKNSEIEY